MAILPNFPALSQLTSVTSDHAVSEDAQFECTAAAIGMGLQWYRGKSAWDTTINPDQLKDISVGQGYVGTTAALSYVPFCKRLGFTLAPIDDTNPAALVQHIHQQLQQGHPVIVTVPDNYVAASLKWSHVVAMYGELGTGLLAMDPYPLPGTNVGHTIHNSDAQWAALLEFNQIWVLTEETMVIDLNNAEVASFFTAGPGAGEWTCKATGKVIGGAILAEYCRYGGSGLNGLTWLGLANSNEIPVESLSSDPKLAGHGIKIQFFELAAWAYDPAHIIDSRPGLTGAVYPLKLYSGGIAQDPYIAQLQKVIAQLKQAPPVPIPAPVGVPPALIADVQSILDKASAGKY